MKIEICVDGPDGVLAALNGGADRIELCAALEMGGLTPSAGLMRSAVRAGLPVYAMMRPRAGDFCWSPPELDLICDDIAVARAEGLAGVVLGASRADGRLDCVALARMAAAAAGLGLTLHRCIDLAPDPGEAVAVAVAIGFERILSSGAAPRAEDGIERLLHLRELAAGRLAIMPGAGVSAGNAAKFAQLGFEELHASCSRGRAVAPDILRFGFAAPLSRQTDAGLVAELVRAVRHGSPTPDAGQG